MSDNGRCYTVIMTPVLMNIIEDLHKMNIEVLMYPESQKGKILIDSHFSIAMRNISPYFKENEKSVMGTGDVRTYLIHYDGVAGRCVELVSLHTQDRPKMNGGMWLWLLNLLLSLLRKDQVK